MAQNPDFEVHGQVTLDNSDVKKKLDETQTEAEKAAKGAGDAIGEAADDASDKVKKKSQETKDQLKKDSEEAGKKAEDTAEDTAEKVKKQFEAGAVAIGNIISGLVSKVADAGKNLILQGIKYNASIEKYRTGLTNMLGDAEQANAALENIKQDAARTPFDTDSLVKANQYLIGAGENAEYSRKTILALGDAVSATGGTSVELERMAQNLQQIANVGEASAVDIKQFAYAGINIYQILADYTGKSIQQVQDMTISYDVLSKALIAASEEGGRYYNSMQTQSETFNGSLNTLKDNVTQLLGSVTEGLSSGLGEWMGDLNQLVLDLNEGVQNGTISFDGMFTSLGAVAGALITYKTYTTVATTAQNLLNAAMNANPIGIVISLLGALAGGLVTAYTTSETFRNRVNDAFSTIKSVASSAISSVSNWLNELVARINGAMAALGDLSHAKTAYENAYNSTRSAYKQNKWNNSHAGMEWDENDGWVSKKSGSSGTSGGTSSGTIESSLFKSTGGSSGGSSGSSSSGSSGSSSTSQKARQVVETYSDVHDEIEDDVKTTTKSITKIFDDGTKQVTTTTTKAGKEIRNGIEKNVSTTETVVQEFADTTTTIASETSKTVQGDITDIEEQAEKSLSEVEKDLKKSLTEESSNGILGILKSGLTSLKNKDWSGIALTVVKLIWGEVDQEQRNDITEWAGNVLKAINQEYASGGLSAAFNAAKKLLTGGELTLGETTLSSISNIITGLTESGGMGTVLGNLVTQLGSGFSTLAANIGSVGTALSGLATKLIGVVASNPEIFAILAIVAGVAALGAYIWKKHGKDISNWWGGLWDSKPSAVSADNYRQSDSITAARLVQESQAAAAANRQSVSSVQNGTGSAAAQQLNASWRGTSTVVLNLDGREVARTTAPYMDEELEFRS